MIQSSLIFQPHATVIAGVDEVGRGPLAGEVIAAAVILDANGEILGLNDSKKLSEKARNRLAVEIYQQALSVSIGRASVEEIDQINILQASLLAMSRAVNNLSILPELCLIDGNKIPRGLPCPAEAIVKGDGKIAAISAASIVAKVYRDQQMYSLHKRQPEYGFDRHKGYGTKQHLAALNRFGPLNEHRKTFAPVRTCIKIHRESNNIS